MKKVLNLLSLIFISTLLYSAQPDWVKSFGMNTEFPLSHNLTGFAMFNRDEPDAVIKAKELALSDLTGKIETKVQSEMTLVETDGTGGYSSSASMITRCTVDVRVSHTEYEVYRGRDNVYALAHISIDELSDFYINNASEIYIDIDNAKKNAEHYIDSNRTDQALSEIYKAKKDFINFYELFSLYSALNPDSPQTSFFQTIDGINNLRALKTMENEISRSLDKLENPESRSFQEAIQKIAVILEKQNINGGNINVPPFNFEQTSFSSEFGRYGASLLEASLVRTLKRASEKTIFRSNYWQNENTIHLNVLVLNEEGHKLGQATAQFPYDSAINSYDLKPQNYEDSMIALKEFADGALTEGGININIWTNKGRDEDSPVYEDGETLQLFMRVNQPAFLQITYHLATGENVLLERSFYIGIDKVNRAVKLPYDFEVQPPLGIEQLIVTAYSVEPPTPNIVIENIDGEDYEVFTSMAAVTAQTRGLKRKQDNNTSEVRVGEAIINLTTIQRD